MGNIIINFLEQNKISLAKEVIVVGVSTGVDSMVLLDELIRAKAQIDFEIVVAHVNHQKRVESIEEEEFIKKYCKMHNLSLCIKRLESSEVNGGNFQSLARTMRYSFFKEVMDKYNSKYLFLAHHANDNIETIIMRLIRGSNLVGYSGMNYVTPLDNYLIVRPFLDILKDEIYGLAQKREIKYYEDASNKENIYTRNRIREEIVPLLFLENPSVNKQFSHFSELIRNAGGIVNNMVENYINSFVLVKDNGVELSRTDFLKLDLFFQNEVLFTLTKSLSLSKANIDELLKLINSHKVNLLVNFKDNLTFVREYEKITLLFYNLEIPKIELVIDECGIYDIDEKRQIIVAKKSNKNLTNFNTLWYNSNMLPITIRSRQDGDRIELSSGSKKVSDLLIDKKIGILQREQCLLVVDKYANILSVLGVEKSSLLKAIKDCDIIITLKEKN